MNIMNIGVVTLPINTNRKLNYDTHHIFLFDDETTTTVDTFGEKGSQRSKGKASVTVRVAWRD